MGGNGAFSFRAFTELRDNNQHIPIPTVLKHQIKWYLKKEKDNNIFTIFKFQPLLKICTFCLSRLSSLTCWLFYLTKFHMCELREVRGGEKGAVIPLASTGRNLLSYLHSYHIFQPQIQYLTHRRGDHQQERTLRARLDMFLFSLQINHIKTHMSALLPEMNNETLVCVV